MPCGYLITVSCVSMWLLVCDSDESDNDRKWPRSEEGEKQSQTGISRFTDVELRAVRGLILAQIFQRIHWNLRFEALGNRPLLPYWETNRSQLEAWADFYTCTRQIRTPELLICTSTTAKQADQAVHNVIFVWLRAVFVRQNEREVKVARVDVYNLTLSFTLSGLA